MTLEAMQILALGTLSLSAPLVLAAMGGWCSERSGVINIGLEGKMLAAACATSLVSVAAKDAVIGLAAGLLLATLLSLLHWGKTQHYRVDAVISGMAINLIAAGGTNFALSKFGDPTQTGAMPSLPLVLFLVSAFASPFVLFAFARSSRPGLRLLAVGSDDEKAALVGINPFTVRAWALAMTGVFTGLAGALLVTNVGTFTDGMTAGRGFIALAALILGRWKPLLALGACLVFGFFEALQLQLQGTQVAGSQVPSQVWSALPYAITVLALAFWMKPRQTASKLVLD